MKTRVIGIIGLAMLGVTAGGCSAEQGGAGQESQPIGENVSTTSQALTFTGKDSITIAGVEYRRDFPASCVIKDTADNKDKLLVVGGYDASGSAQPDVF